MSLEGSWSTVTHFQGRWACWSVGAWVQQHSNCSGAYEPIGRLFYFFNASEGPLPTFDVVLGQKHQVARLQVSARRTPLLTHLEPRKVLADETLEELVRNVLDDLPSSAHVVGFRVRFAAIAPQQKQMVGRQVVGIGPHPSQGAVVKNLFRLAQERQQLFLGQQAVPHQRLEDRFHRSDEFPRLPPYGAHGAGWTAIRLPAPTSRLPPVFRWSDEFSRPVLCPQRRNSCRMNMTHAVTLSRRWRLEKRGMKISSLSNASAMQTARVSSCCSSGGSSNSHE